VSNATYSTGQPHSHALVLSHTHTHTHTQFNDSVDYLKKELESRDIDYAFVSGNLSAKERDVQMHKFNEIDNCKVFILTTKSGSVGINLTRCVCVCE
jgi:superfamily II DNA/RNA helicase